VTGVDVIGAVTMGGLVATGLTMARLTAELDGRNTPHQPGRIA
jgi:hypothetical protein